MQRLMSAKTAATVEQFNLYELNTNRLSVYRCHMVERAKCHGCSHDLYCTLVMEIRKRSGDYSVLLGNYDLHLVRIGTLLAARVNCCSHVIIGMGWGHRGVDKPCAGI
jgi:hypothetical protein